MSEENSNKENSTKSTFRPGTRSIVEIINDLTKPVAPRHIRKKRQGGKEISYISWYDRVKYLDYFAPGWSNEIVRMDSIAGKLILIVELKIPASDGVFSRQATGQESEDLDAYGDSSSNAEAMAFSRASSKFGLGLYLYSEK